MSFSSDSKEQISLKKLVGKAHTKNEFEFYNESKSTGITISAGAVFGQDLPATPTRNALYQITNSVVEYVRLPLTPLPESIQNGKYHAFSAALPSTYENSSDDSVSPGSSNPNKGNGVFESNAEIHASLGKLQLVPTSFGDLYVTKVFYGGTDELGTGNEISSTDSRRWYLDYFNGILFQQNPPDNPNSDDHLNNPNNPSYIEAFLYIGKMASERFTEGGGGSGSNGQNGADGADFTFKGTQPTHSALSQVSNPQKGDAYIVDIDETTESNLENVIYVYNGTSFVSGGSLKGDDGADGAAGNGISSITENSGVLTINFTDSGVASFVTPDLTGPQGVSIANAELVSGSLVLTLSDNNQITVDGVKGADGQNGANGTGFTGGSYNASTGIVTLVHEDPTLNVVTDDLRGADGISIISGSISNNDLELTMSDNNVITILNVKGADGNDGNDGNGISSITENNGVLTFNFTDSGVAAFETSNLTGPKGEDGTSINFRGQVAQNPSGSGTVTLLGSPPVTHTPDNGDAVISTVDDSLFVYNGNDWISGGSIQGPQGEQGETGSSIVFKGAVSADPTEVADTTSITPIGGVTFTPAVGHAVLSQASDSLFVYDGSIWISGGSIQGPQGEKGDQGPGIVFKGAVSADPTNTADTTSITTIDGVTFPPNEGDAVLSQASDSLFIYNGTSWVSGGSIQGLQGETGAAAPVITNISIENNVITTTLDNNSTVDGTFTASTDNLSDVHTTGNYLPSPGQVLKWTLVSGSAESNPVYKWVPSNDLEFTADTSSLWAEGDIQNPSDPEADQVRELFPHGIIDGTLDTGMFAINLSAGSINYSDPNVTLHSVLEELSSMNAYTPSTKSSANINDTFFEIYTDPNDDNGAECIRPKE